MREIPQKGEGGGLIFPVRCHSEARSAEESLNQFDGRLDPIPERAPNKTGPRARKPGGPSPRCHGEGDQKSGRFSDRMKVTIERGDEQGNEGNSSFLSRRHRSLNRSRSFAASASGRNGFAR